jgi:hypothetical protein
MFLDRCPTDWVRGGELFKRVVISALSQRTEPSSKPRAGRRHCSGQLGLLRGLHHQNALILYRGRAAPRSDRRHTCSLFGYDFGMSPQIIKCRTARPGARQLCRRQRTRREATGAAEIGHFRTHALQHNRRGNGETASSRPCENSGALIQRFGRALT